MYNIKEKLTNTYTIIDEHQLDLYLELVSTNNYDGCEYAENHHILPRKKFPKYINEDWNIVRLKYEDHVLAHYYLAQATGDKGMLYAYWRMSGKLNSDYINKLMSGAYSGENNPACQPGIGEKISKSKTGKERPDMVGKRYFGADTSTIERIKEVSSKTHSGMVIVKDKNGNRFKVSVNDERYLSGDLVSFNKGEKRNNSASKRPEVMAKILNTRSQTYNRYASFTFTEFVDFLVDAHNDGKKIFGKKTLFSSNYSKYVNMTSHCPSKLKESVVQRLEKDNILSY